MIVALLLLFQAWSIYFWIDPADFPNSRQLFLWPALAAVPVALWLGDAVPVAQGFIYLSFGSIPTWWAVHKILTFLGFLDKAPPPGSEKLKRGAEILDNKTLQKTARKAGPSALFLSNIPIPYHLENRHFLITGTTGAGKSQAFYQVAERARARSESAIVPDVNGEFVRRFYREGVDILLSPHDQRSPAWSPLAEMGGPWDAERIAKSIIPEGDGSGAEWSHYAQVLLTAILLKTWQNRGSNGDLVQSVLYSQNQELGALVAGTPAQMMFGDGSEKMLASIRAILASYTGWLQDLPPAAGAEAFSISRFVKTTAENSTGQWLFFPVRDDQFKSLKPLISAWIDLSISALLSSQDDEDRRVWFFVDEFASWGRIEGIEPLLTKARKKGGVGVLGLQAISQLRENYGIQKSQTILSNSGTWLTLRCGDAETADYMSRTIGEQEITRIVNSGSDQGESWGEQHSKQRAIMPAELQSLSDLIGILNIVGNLPAGWVQIPISGLQKIAEAFVFPDYSPQQKEPEKTTSREAEPDIENDPFK